MATIALVRPPQVMPIDVLGISQGTPSIGVAYLNGSLKNANHDVTIVDALGEGLNSFHRYGNSKLLINGLTAEEIPNKIPNKIIAKIPKALFIPIGTPKIKKLIIVDHINCEY